jgi:hypothetical protein
MLAIGVLTYFGRGDSHGMAMGWPYFADLIGLSWGNRMTDVLD